MTVNLSFSEFTNLLPTRVAPFERVAGAPEGTEPPPERATDSFIAPEILVHDHPQNAQVFLVSAGAGVGKSTMARALSRDTKNPFWDLGKFQLGSGFITGTIADTFGDDNFPRVRSELTNGAGCLILDAADEAMVATSTSAVAAALDNLASVAVRSEGERPTAIILGRSDTIAFVWDKLTDSGVSVAHFEVAYFAEPAARKYVSVRAEKLSRGKVLDSFDEFVDRFFEEVKGALGSTEWGTVGTFLGYAPVLESLATFYAKEENPFARLQDVLSVGDYSVWQLVAQMLENVLERDREKFASSFSGGDDRKYEYAHRAYSIESQLRLLLSDDATGEILGDDITDDRDYELDWHADLQTAAQSFFRDHAFLRGGNGDHRRNPLNGFQSPAFRDFSIARAMQCLEEEELERLAAHWRANDVVPSTMLTRFAAMDASDVTLSQYCLPMLVDSHSSEARVTDDSGRTARTLLVIEWGDNEDVDDVVSLQTISRSGGAGARIMLRVDPQMVRLGRKLCWTHISLPGATVSFGGAVAKSTLGPGVNISADAMVVGSRELVVARPVASNSISATISVGCIDGPVMNVSANPPDCFALIGPSVGHPWRRYVRAADSSKAIDQHDVTALGLELRAFLGRFERGQKRFACEKVDVLVAKRRVRRELVNYCESAGIIWRDGDAYRYDPKVSLDALRQLDLGNPDLVELVRGYGNHLSMHTV